MLMPATDPPVRKPSIRKGSSALTARAAFLADHELRTGIGWQQIMQKKQLPMAVQRQQRKTKRNGFLSVCQYHWLTFSKPMTHHLLFAQIMVVVNWPRGVTVSTLDSESSDRGSNPREAFSSHSD